MLLGPNGCGKSTLLRVLAGELAAGMRQPRLLPEASLPKIVQPVFIGRGRHLRQQCELWAGVCVRQEALSRRCTRLMIHRHTARGCRRLIITVHYMSLTNAAGLFRPDSGSVAVLPPYAFVFQNPDHQVVMPTVAADVAFGLGR